MTERRHGDPFDYPDIPGPSGLSDAYVQAVMPQHVKDAIARRKAERSAQDAGTGTTPRSDIKGSD